MTTTMPRGVERFIDDDAGYLAWLRVHPMGFVLNTERSPRAGYLVMHRASCRSISRTTAVGMRSWTTNYIKVCSDDRGQIEKWAKDRTDEVPWECGHCFG